MGIADVVWMVLVLGGAACLFHRSFWRRKGNCHGCAGSACSGTTRAPRCGA